jgi:WD40 repeat protein
VFRASRWPNGSILSLGSLFVLWKFDEANDALARLDGHAGRVYDFAFSLCGTFLASASYDMTIRLWHVHERCCVQTLEGHEHQLRSIAYSPNSKFLVFGCDNRTMKFWNVTNGKCLTVGTIRTGNDKVQSVGFSPDGQTLVSHKGGMVHLVTRECGQVHFWNFSSRTVPPSCN